MNIVEYKVGHHMLKITDVDRVVFNGAVYILKTQKVGTWVDEHSPIIAKAKATKLVKTGVLVPVENYISRFSGVDTEYDQYKFDLDKLEQHLRGEL